MVWSCYSASPFLLYRQCKCLGWVRRCMRLCIKSCWKHCLDDRNTMGCPMISMSLWPLRCQRRMHAFLQWIGHWSMEVNIGGMYLHINGCVLSHTSIRYVSRSACDLECTLITVYVIGLCRCFNNVRLLQSTWLHSCRCLNGRLWCSSLCGKSLAFTFWVASVFGVAFGRLVKSAQSPTAISADRFGNRLLERYYGVDLNQDIVLQLVSIQRMMLKMFIEVGEDQSAERLLALVPYSNACWPIE